MGLPGAGLHQFLPDPFRDEETKTECPVCHATGVERCRGCNGTLVKELQPIPGQPSVYRRIMCQRCNGKEDFSEGPCQFCHGKKMVNASSASSFRRKALESALTRR